VPLKSIDVQLTVRGFVGNVVTTLLYKNTEKNPIEAVFEFPIDDQSAVYQFEAKIEDRVIIAECQEKEQVLIWLPVICHDNKIESLMFYSSVLGYFETRAHQKMRYPNVTWRIICFVHLGLFTTELRHAGTSRIFF